MPDARLQKTRDAYDGWISQDILAKRLRYLGDNRVLGMVNGQQAMRLVDGNDLRWPSYEEPDSMSESSIR